ncbi:membrane protein [Labrys miyagiensis]
MLIARILIAAIAAAGSMGTALAADLSPAPVEPAPPPAAYNWTGFYAGANLGWGWGDIKTSDNTVTTSGALVGIAPGTFDPPATFLGANSKSHDDGFLGGAQLGYNYQIDQWVIGAEADYQGIDIKTDSAFLGSAAGPYYQTSAKLESFGTLRARVGYAWDDLLAYGTAGLAVGQGKASLAVQGGVPGAFTGPRYSDDDTEWMVGFAVGAGLEYAIMHSNWSVKAEYLYADFGKKDFRFSFAGTGGDSARSKGHVTASLARLGLNYRF